MRKMKMKMILEGATGMKLLRAMGKMMILRCKWTFLGGGGGSLRVRGGGKIRLLQLHGCPVHGYALTR